MSFVSEVSRDRAKSVTDQLTESCNKTYYGGACTERAKKRPANGSCSFVGHVCEEIDDADDQDKSEGQFCYILFSL